MLHNNISKIKACNTLNLKHAANVKEIKRKNKFAGLGDVVVQKHCPRSKRWSVPRPDLKVTFSPSSKTLPVNYQCPAQDSELDLCTDEDLLPEMKKESFENH